VAPVETPVPVETPDAVAVAPAEVVEEQATTEAQPAQLRIDEQPTPDQQPAAVAAQPGALPAAVDVVIRGAVADIAQQEPVETGASSSGRACALIGMPGLVKRYGAEVLDDLERLLGSMAAATSAVGAGEPQSLVIVGDRGTLVAGVSTDGSALLVLRAEAGIKMGRLRVAAQRVKSVARQMRGAGVCPIAVPDLPALQPDADVERQTAEQLGLRAGAFGGRDRMVLLMDGLACAGLVASAGESVFENALTAAVYAGTGVIERILVEGADGGLVVGSCGPAGEVLVAVSAETAAKMGAANVTVTKMRDAVRGERA
jgi:predicted regulator of Ras-like GTPase activity (Roadblock/LC7/MglB family)